VREIVKRKDAFTRMNMAREEEKRKNILEREAALLAAQKKKKECINKVKSELSELTKDENPHKRGKSLEKVLNGLFACYDILVSEAFVVTGRNSEGVVEQIDGAIEFEGHCYLVEMKWWHEKIGRNELAVHLVNLHNRGGEVRGLFISYSPYSDPAIIDCCNSLNRGITVVLARLDEIYKLLDKEYDLKVWLKEKINMALTHKEPLFIVDISFD
jgi:restriction system protein